MDTTMSPETAPPDATGQRRLAFLDAVRAVAALLVFAEHSLDGVIPGYREWTAANFYPGRVGVIVFLLVSGFIIPVSLEQGGSNAIFWLRRVFRLFPLYWLSILVAYLHSGSGGVATYSPWVWLTNLTMLQGFVGCPHVVGLFWTLQLELVIYIACSALFMAGLLKRAAWITGLFLVGYAVVGVVKPLLFNGSLDVGGQRWLYFAPMVGLVAHRYWVGRLGLAAMAAVVLGHFAVVGVVWSVNRALFPGSTSVRVLYETAWTWGLTYACFFGVASVPSRFLPGAACWVGRISYSVYLLHPFVLAALLPTTGGNWLYLLAALASTLLLAQLTFQFVERPGIALGRAIEKRWRPGPEPAPALAEPLRQAA